MLNNKGFSLISGVLVSLIIGLLALFVADTIKIFSTNSNRSAIKVNLNVAIDAINKYHRCCNIIQNHATTYSLAIPASMSEAFYSSHREVNLIGNNNYPLNNLLSPFTARGYVAPGETRGIVVQLRHNNPKEYFQRDLSSFTDIANIIGISSIICPMGLDYNSGSETCNRESTATSSPSSATSTSGTTTASSSTTTASSSTAADPCGGSCNVNQVCNCSTGTLGICICEDVAITSSSTTSVSSSSSASSTSSSSASTTSSPSSSSSTSSSSASTTSSPSSSSSVSASSTSSSSGDPCGGSCNIWEVCLCIPTAGGCMCM